MNLRFETTIPAPLDEVFSFFENPANLAVLHQTRADRAGRAVRLLHHEGTVRPGATTWVEANVFGIMPVVMGFEHREYDPPHCFSETMIHGPFAEFTHEHRFAASENATIVSDALCVRLPLVYGGAAAMRYVVAPFIERMFRQRARALHDLFVSREHHRSK